jgi:hypothetical protein
MTLGIMLLPIIINDILVTGIGEQLKFLPCLLVPRGGSATYGHGVSTILELQIRGTLAPDSIA